MSHFLRVTVRFLDPEPTYNGKRDGGEPEWPPSPLRLFQALVDAAASRWRGTKFNEYAKPQLARLERHTVLLVTPSHQAGTPFRIAVPNNDLDVWAVPVSKGNEPRKQPNELKTMKIVHPMRLRVTNRKCDDALYYLFPLEESSESERNSFVSIIGAAARSITHLGWGIDLVAADADAISEEDAVKLPGHRWRIVPAGGVPLRTPIAGTLDDLVRKHKDFHARVSGGRFRPVPPLSAFRVVHYRRATDAPVRPVAAFELRRTIAEQAELPSGKSTFRPFGAVHKFATVAGMVRHATANIAEQAGWDKNRIVSFIQGHGDEKDGQSTTDERLMFLPLPSITPLKVESIRRVLVVGPVGSDLSQLSRLLNGAELFQQGRTDPVAMLSFVPKTDRNVQGHYLRESAVWSTVTPMMLPGYDDPDSLRRKLKERIQAAEQKHLLERLDRRVLELIFKGFVQAGWSPELMRETVIEYRKVGFRPGLDLAHNYELPPMKYPRYHVRVRFPHAVRGPVAVGAGRYRGLGLFASES